MLQWFAENVRRFGIYGLEFDLTEESQKRLLWASILPAIAMAALVFQLIGDVFFDAGQFEVIESGTEEFWRKANAVALNAHFAAGAAMFGVFFLVAIGPVTRAVGSWALVAAATMLSACLALGAVVVVLHAFIDPYGTEYQEWRIYTWIQWMYSFGAIGAGFAFLAYRGLSAPPLSSRQIIRRRRSRPRPRTNDA